MIQYHQNFQARYKKTPETIQEKCIPIIETLLLEPHHPILSHTQLRGAFSAWHSIQVHGDYRLIFQYITGTLILHDIGTHTQLYQ